MKRKRRRHAVCPTGGANVAPPPRLSPRPDWLTREASGPALGAHARPGRSGAPRDRPHLCLRRPGACAELPEYCIREHEVVTSAPVPEEVPPEPGRQGQGSRSSRPSRRSGCSAPVWKWWSQSASSRRCPGTLREVLEAALGDGDGVFVADAELALGITRAAAVKGARTWKSGSTAAATTRRLPRAGACIRF